MPPPSAETQEFRHMGSLTTRDGTTLFYKDWGHGPPVVFSHGWPLCSDAWEVQMLHLASHGFRCIAHDRRGHGRSSQPYAGNDMDTYADDLYALMEHLDLRGAMMVGHSTGGGEVARVIGRHGTSRVAKAVLVGAVTPIMVKTAANPDGLPMEVFDGIRAAMRKDRSQLFRDFAGAFFGADRAGSQVSQGMRDSFWLQGMMGGLKNQHDCVAAFSETDLTEDLRKMTVPVLVIHGDDDQVVPVATTAMRTAKLVPKAVLKIYPGGAHGLTDTAREQLSADLLAFARS
jgi:non-heme chloroperoxidase